MRRKMFRALPTITGLEMKAGWHPNFSLKENPIKGELKNCKSNPFGADILIR